MINGVRLLILPDPSVGMPFPQVVRFKVALLLNSSSFLEFINL